MPTNTATKTLLKIPDIIELYRQGKTQKEIAGIYGVDRRTIRDVEVRPEAQKLLREMSNQLTLKHLADLEEILEKGTPIDKRDALKERGRMIRSLNAKIIPSRHEIVSETTHRTVSPVDLAWRQFFDIACPDCQRSFIAHINKDLPDTPRYVEAESEIVR